MRTLQDAGRTNLRRALALSVSVTAVCAAALAPTPAHAVSITDGLYISEYYNDGVNPAGFSATFGNIIGYTNGIHTQGNVVIDPSNGNNQAYATATVGGSMAVSILGSGTTTNPSTTEAIAETWDTLIISNYSSLVGNVSANTVIGTLNLTVNQTVSTTTNATSATAIGLGVFFNNSFLPVLTGGDCGPVATLQCSGLIPAAGLGGANPATNGGTIGINGGGSDHPGAIINLLTTSGPNPLVYRIPLTLAEVSIASGNIAYIAEIGASLTTLDSSASSVVIDPSIAITGLYPGLSVSSSSGSNYSPVPLPAAAWLLGSGLLGLAAIAGRRRGLATG
jgi:hypothetical protein